MVVEKSANKKPGLGTFFTLSIGIGGMIAGSLLIETVYRLMTRRKLHFLSDTTKASDKS